MTASAPLRALLLGLLSCLALLASPTRALPQAAKDDVITLTDNKTESGKVVAEDYDGLQLEIKKGGKKKIEWSKIASVQYMNLPLEYTDALEARGSDPPAALEQLDALAKQDGLDVVVRQSAMFELASLQARTGALDDAIASWNALIAAYPEGRYLGRAARGLVDALLAKDDVAGAGKALDSLGANPSAGKFAALGLELKLQRGRIQMVQKKYADARLAFQAVEKDAGTPPAAAAAARLGVAESLKEEGKADEAKAAFEKLVDADGPTSLLAGAWNGMGDLLSKKGADTRNADMLTDALYAYLRGVVQYLPAAGEPQDEYERALGGSAKCFRLLSQLETKKERKDYYDKLFTQQAQRLRDANPNSPYLKQF